MKTVFCLDDKIKYLTLLKVAVRSLRAVQGKDALCLCVYAGMMRPCWQNSLRKIFLLRAIRRALTQAVSLLWDRPAPDAFSN